MMDLGLNPKQVFPVLDFYHAVEHLAKVAQLRKKWTAKERKSWLTKHRRLLKQGEVEAVIKQIRSLCRGGSKAIRTELNYFIKHKAHMAYDKLKALGLPIGSGAIESAIRCSACSQFAYQRACDLLERRKRRGNHIAPLLFQGWPLEHIEKYSVSANNKGRCIVHKTRMRP